MPAVLLGGAGGSPEYALQRRLLPCQASSQQGLPCVTGTVFPISYYEMLQCARIESEFAVRRFLQREMFPDFPAHFLADFLYYT